eukprot:CAMPEP_0197286424 /NCGR_PEP_ID=MMETSP0890-20130614/1837_1 /TAXON_ID=44058 ORGANISM="Aureoumbra lagunensis, Strain CCMP1510" /NCGR_SAMPLE_ID=MMETSP0890 /ASSEMBLY_ACC=CAM_ASM_000533 /LENGTH=79 /DNA_ID=CAMNT_0042754723 /DNA_START=320 /DNA_END=559 /DNA_ORIENTATION=-
MMMSDSGKPEAIGTAYFGLAASAFMFTGGVTGKLSLVGVGLSLQTLVLITASKILPKILDKRRKRSTGHDPSETFSSEA